MEQDYTWPYIKLKRERDKAFKEAEEAAKKEVEESFKKGLYNKIIKSYKKDIENIIKQSKNLLNFKFIPKNELGVIALFIRYFEVLGFEKIIDIKPQFPDCIAIKKGGKEKTRIEFEFKSSNFNHDLNKCDIVICWEKDKELPIETIELKHKLWPFISHSEI